MNNDTLKAALADLTEILMRERKALEAMDVASVEELSQNKLRCLSALETATPEEKKHIDKRDVHEVLTLARDNQRLLVHARACIRGALSALAGTGTGGEQRAPSPIRLNVRG